MTISLLLTLKSIFKITLSHISGGGLHNPTLLKMLDKKCQEINRQVEFKEVYDYSSVWKQNYQTCYFFQPLSSEVDELGLSADFKEATAFAILGYLRLLEVPANLPETTGAKRSCLLGVVNK